VMWASVVCNEKENDDCVIVRVDEKEHIWLEVINKDMKELGMCKARTE